MDVRRDGGETAVVQVGEAALAGPMDFLRSVVVPQSGEKVQCMGPIARGYERCTRKLYTHPKHPACHLHL